MVTDFYRKSKICVSKWSACLLEPLIMAVKEEQEDMDREIYFTIPTGFCIDKHFSDSDFGAKSDEANIFFSYLFKNREAIKREHCMTERQFDMLVSKLEVVLVRNYAVCNWFRKTWKLVWAYVGLFESFLMGD